MLLLQSWCQWLLCRHPRLHVMALVHFTNFMVKLLRPRRCTPRVIQGDRSCQDQTLMSTQCLLMSSQGVSVSVSEALQS